MIGGGSSLSFLFSFSFASFFVGYILHTTVMVGEELDSHAEMSISEWMSTGGLREG